jgi:hypothetical protein
MDSDNQNGDYVPYQQAKAVLEQLNSVNAALEKHFGPASIAEVSQYIDVYRKRIAELEKQLEDKADIVSNALRKAWGLGQKYWQQADSEYTTQHRKSEKTQENFMNLVDDTRESILSKAANKT